MLQITWLGHSTFSLTLDSGEVVVIDPFVSGNPSFPPGYDFSRVDIILATHGHGDHISGIAELSNRFSPHIVANYEVATWLAGQGIKNTIGMNIGGSMTVGSLKVTMTPAVHSSMMEQPDGTTVYGGLAGGYVLHLADGRNAYFAGDTDVFGDMALIRELHSPELAVLPIGDFYTMSPRGAAIATRLLQPHVVIPSHYGTFPVLTGTPEELQALVSCKVLTLEPGVPITW